jgi:hypothetical protein
MRGGEAHNLVQIVVTPDQLRNRLWQVRWRQRRCWPGRGGDARIGALFRARR